MLRIYNRKLKKHMGHREFNFIFSERSKNRDISFKFEKREQRSLFIFSINKEKKTGWRFFLKCKRGYFNLERSRYDIGFLLFIFIVYWQVGILFFFFFTLYVKSKFLFENL